MHINCKLFDTAMHVIRLSFSPRFSPFDKFCVINMTRRNLMLLQHHSIFFNFVLKIGSDLIVGVICKNISSPLSLKYHSWRQVKEFIHNTFLYCMNDFKVNELNTLLCLLFKLHQLSNSLSLYEMSITI